MPRDCLVKDISDQRKLISDFLNENHIQKNCKGNRFVYGLYYNDELVQLISFGNPRYNKNYQYELIRDCTKKDYLVRGGLSKLWKFFLGQKNVRFCIVYFYPHESGYTNKYVDCCGFKNVDKSHPTKSTVFRLEEDNKSVKEITLQELNRIGVDRFLDTNIRKDYKSNEEILIELGFEKILFN